MKKCLSILFACCAIAGETSAMEGRLSERITLKTPGNPAATYDLRESATEGGGGILPISGPEQIGGMTPITAEGFFTT